ncbi:Ig-like domain-containing protein [Kluyvera intermedia]|uniref:Ig-like domain-containing protein n=1 Tax=Kluyvera intermedia TaxID=61648 RepID=UPI0035232158
MSYTALFPPYLPQMTDDGYINEIELISSAGVEVIINRYGTVSIGDYLVLYWDGQKISSLTLTSANFQDAFPWITTIPIQLAPDGSYNVWFSVTDIAQNPSVSGLATALIKRSRTGELPPPTFPNATDDLIDTASVILNNGTHVHIPNTDETFSTGDNITLYWAGLDESGQPVSESITSVPHHVSEDDLPDNLDILIIPPYISAINKGIAWAYYSIKSTSGLRNSDSACVGIDLSTQIRYPAPPVKEADETWINCDTAADGVIVTILGNPLFKADSIVTVHWQGYDLQDSPLPTAHYTVDHRLSEDETTAGFSITIPANKIFAVSIGYALTWYQVNTPSPQGNSTITRINIDTIHCDPLPPPTFPAADDGVIDSTDIENDTGTIMVLSWPDIQAGDNFTAFWQGYISSPDAQVPGTSWTESRNVTESEATSGEVNCLVPAHFINPIRFGKAQGRYQVLFNDGGRGKSDTTDVTVRTGGRSNPDAIINMLGILTDNAPADGVAENSVSATIVDGDHNLLAGQLVTFSASNGARIKSPGITGKNGIATTTLTSFFEGYSVVTAKINDDSKQITVNFTESGDNQHNAVITFIGITQDNAWADGITTNTVAVLVTDNNGQSLSGQSVTFEANNDASILSPVISDKSGFANTTLTSLVSGYSTVTAVINDSSQSIDVYFVKSDDNVPDAIINSLMVIKNFAIADGIDSNEIQALVTDENGNPLSDQNVIFEASAGTSVFSPVVTTAGGMATTTLTSTIVGEAVVTATVNSSSQSITVDFIENGGNNPEARIALMGIKQDNARADGFEQNSVEVTITDILGVALAGQSVIFTATDGASVSSPVSTDNMGHARAVLTSTTPGVSTVTAMINSDSRHVNVTFTAT